MGTIADVKTNLQARALTLLTSYKKHAFSVDTSQNKFKGNNKGLSVLPGGAGETDSLIGSFTLDHTFNYTLTNSYNAGAKSQLGDSLKVQRIQELMDDCLSIYNDVRVNKAAINSKILVINDMSISGAEFDDDEKTISVKFSINVKYKTNIA